MYNPQDISYHRKSVSIAWALFRYFDTMLLAQGFWAVLYAYSHSYQQSFFDKSFDTSKIQNHDHEKLRGYMSLDYSFQASFRVLPMVKHYGSVVEYVYVSEQLSSAKSTQKHYAVEMSLRKAAKV